MKNLKNKCKNKNIMNIVFEKWCEEIRQIFDFAHCVIVYTFQCWELLKHRGFTYKST